MNNIEYDLLQRTAPDGGSKPERRGRGQRNHAKADRTDRQSAGPDIYSGADQ